MKSMLTPLSLEYAAQAWTKPETSHKEMDVDLVCAVAEIIEEILSKPWLGNATTGELLDEIRARVNCDYKTVGGEDISARPPHTRDSECECR
jgi:hypothetical protein